MCFVFQATFDCFLIIIPVDNRRNKIMQSNVRFCCTLYSMSLFSVYCCISWLLFWLMHLPVFGLLVVTRCFKNFNWLWSTLVAIIRDPDSAAGEFECFSLIASKDLHMWRPLSAQLLSIPAICRRCAALLIAGWIWSNPVALALLIASKQSRRY